MTRDPDLIGLIEGYLDDFEGHTPLPDAVRDTVRARLPSTTQRPAWWPGWRSIDMNIATKYVLGAAAAVLVALVGIQLTSPGGGFGSSADPTPIVSSAPSAVPVPTASTEAAAIVIGEGYLDRVEVSAPRFAGWRLEANFAGKGEIGFSAWTVDAVYPDPCQWEDERLDLSRPPTVDEIVTALVAQAGRDPSRPAEVTLGGMPATRFELVTPADLDIATCDQGRYKAWTERSDPGGGNWNHQPGQMDIIYVVDVDGGPVVVDIWRQPSTSGADLGELESVVEAMEIDLRDE